MTWVPEVSLRYDLPMSTERTKPLDRDVRYVVQKVIEDLNDGTSFVLVPIAEYPLRDLEVGDILQPVDFDPAWAE